jgi:hypothetical protein
MFRFCLAADTLRKLKICQKPVTKGHVPV